ncbi:MAG: hypothetical protein WDM71_03960 [Ferruginibacter sp.]
MIYGADVSGTVFKAISDKIYARFVADTKFHSPSKTIDTVSYNYYGLKNDLNSIFNETQSSVVDSTVGRLLEKCNNKR